ncbi:MAG: hypothetical protein QCI38_07040 [Candidatus Thermoplasmatota archaeon]|nr:hypothetical protein [Candidatus Thermoplasmatota archaeon]
MSEKTRDVVAVVLVLLIFGLGAIIMRQLQVSYMGFWSIQTMAVIMTFILMGAVLVGLYQKKEASR